VSARCPHAPRLRLVVAAVLLAATCFPTTAAAQPSFSVSLGGTLDSFAAVSFTAEQRQNVSGTVDLDHVVAGERGRVFYTVDGGNFDTPGDWSYFLHQAGMTFRFGQADAGARKLFLNASVVARRNGDAWSSAEYTAAGGGVNVELHPAGTTFKAGYRADYRRFSDYGALTQAEHRAFASVLRSFETRTTVIAEAQVGAKHYDASVITDVITAETQVPTGNARGSASGHGAGGSLLPGIRTIVTTTNATTTASGSAGLVTAMMRVAHAVTDRTGVQVQATLRRTFGVAPPALVTTPAGFFEDGVYDDPFASDALFLRAGATHTFAGGAELEAAFWWADKDYTGAVALDAAGVSLAGSPLRADHIRLAQASWIQPLLASRTGAVAISADLGYRYLRHRSNDAFYDYTSHAVMAGLTVTY
jgi:hypothetical protein